MKTDPNLMKGLELLEGAFAKSRDQSRALRKRAEDIFEERVEQIAKDQNISKPMAYAKAQDDDIAKRAYDMAAEFAEDEAVAVDGQLWARDQIG